MTWMEVDCNLKILANFFKLFLCISEKSLENNYSLFFRQNFSIFFPVLYEQFHFLKKNRLFVKYLSGFDENIAKLPWQCPFNPVESIYLDPNEFLRSIVLPKKTKVA